MYDHRKTEEKWLKTWEKSKLFLQTETQEVAELKDKMYLLFAFAYPSGSGLHVGHVESKTALDILARYYRMHEKSVFFPVGWDAFGLPAENYAIKTGIPPVETTKTAIDTFRRQIKRLGISYDWANEIATCHPGYYQWTQWLFLELFQAGLAYQDTGMVNWCPSCQTVLANEQVVNGLCERCDTQVTQKEMKQWYFKITEYKDELISGLEQVDWPAPTKQQQLNWIGKSQGAEIEFELTDQEKTKISCFTTRPDTIFGVTCVVMSPEKFRDLELIKSLKSKQRQEISVYLKAAFRKTEEDRQIGEKEKTGVKTGLEAINPVNGAQVPLYVADYVLGGYGTGAVMGVPAHDKRDFAFAQKHGLEIRQVVSLGEKYDPQQWQDSYAEYGQMINSGEFDGVKSEAALPALVKKYPEKIRPQTTYKLRDWLISRQRYWGTPIPIVYDPDGKPHPVKKEHLPWELPTDVDFKPTGESPLRSSEEFKARTEKLYGPGWTPEYDTMDTFVDSSWYYLRYVSSRDESVFSAPEQLKKWLPVDFYMIGPEHIVLHLLYSRFFTKFLRDQGYLKFDEPFMKMRHQGMILGPDGKKMSKSKGNVINPDEVVEKFGADTLRMYEMFMGPIEADKPWDVGAVTGVYRFLNRIYGLIQGRLKLAREAEVDVKTEVDSALQRKFHQTIKKVSQDIPLLKFNTAIAMMMELVNLWEETLKKQKTVSGQKAVAVIPPKEVLAMIKVLAAFAPFMGEELYAKYKQAVKGESEAESVHLTTWPEWDEELAQEEEVQIAVQINGKVRGQVLVPSDLLEDKEQVLALAKEVERVLPYLEGKTLKKEIYVPGKIVSLVV